MPLFKGVLASCHKAKAIKKIYIFKKITFLCKVKRLKYLESTKLLK